MDDDVWEAVYQAAVNSNPNSEYVDQINPERFVEILGDLGFRIVEDE